MQIYKHLKTGGLYQKITEAYIEASGETERVVVYKSLENGQTWTRPKAEFEDGRFELQPAYVPEEVARYLEDSEEVEFAASELVRVCHGLAAASGWWKDPATGKQVQRNTGELLMLIVSEIAEAMEGDRKGLKDDKLPQRDMIEVELADALIRIFDMAGGLQLDVAGALVEKLKYNATRADHKPENRKKSDGKKY